MNCLSKSVMITNPAQTRISCERAIHQMALSLEIRASEMNGRNSMANDLENPVYFTPSHAHKR